MKLAAAASGKRLICLASLPGFLYLATLLGCSHRPRVWMSRMALAVLAKSSEGPPCRAVCGVSLNLCSPSRVALLRMQVSSWARLRVKKPSARSLRLRARTRSTMKPRSALMLASSPKRTVPSKWPFLAGSARGRPLRALSRSAGDPSASSGACQTSPCRRHVEVALCEAQAF